MSILLQNISMCCFGEICNPQLKRPAMRSCKEQQCTQKQDNCGQIMLTPLRHKCSDLRTRDGDSVFSIVAGWDHALGTPIQTLRPRQPWDTQNRCSKSISIKLNWKKNAWILHYYNTTFWFPVPSFEILNWFYWIKNTCKWRFVLQIGALELYTNKLSTGKYLQLHNK